MKDIKDYLEKANAKHWKRLRKHPPAFLEKVGKEITTEKMQEVIAEDAKELAESVKTLDSILEKLDQCLALQEKNIQTLDNINDILVGNY